MPKKIRSKLSFPEAIRLWEKHQLNRLNPDYWVVYDFFRNDTASQRGKGFSLLMTGLILGAFFLIVYIYFFVERFEGGIPGISLLGLASFLSVLRFYRERAHLPAIQAAKAAREEEERHNDLRERKRKLKRKKHNRPKGYK